MKYSIISEIEKEINELQKKIYEEERKMKIKAKGSEGTRLASKIVREYYKEQLAEKQRELENLQKSQ